MDENEPKNTSVNFLTLVPHTMPGGQKALEHREMEALAASVAQEFRARSRTLRALRPEVERIHDYFISSVRGSVRLAGCASFAEYCKKQLGHSRQAVYSMLGNYREKQKEKKKRLPKHALAYELGMTQEDVSRMQTALNAVYRFGRAKEEGNQETALSAWEEFTRIAEAEPLKSHIAGDQPNLKLILTELLSLIDKALAVLKRILESGMIARDAELTTDAETSARTAVQFCSAVRRRLNIADSAIQKATH